MSRHYQTADTANLEAWMAHDHLSTNEAAEKLGLSRSGLVNMRRKKQVPRSLDLLIRANIVSGSTHSINVHVALVPVDKLPAYISFCRALQIATQEISLP